MSGDFEHRIRNVTAVLGPTNTGKTHLAIERMLGHQSGLIGLPLRLLAREVYDRIVARVGADAVALVTGEEKIKPDRARYFVCTVEAMPREADVEFLAVDEVQLAADPERGHVFTDRILHVRGKHETLLLGAQTMRETISELIPGANFISRPRLSKLTFAGDKKITRLPPRSAIVAFSAAEVYSIAELMRRQRGGAAVVLGALSPRTRNAQVALYQSGDVDFIVATDAIGMGLNLDVDHVAFAGIRKFDGQVHRDLTPAELAQIAGRAGRYMNDGTFGTTGSVEPFSADVIERLEQHTFDNVKSVQWRTRELDFSSVENLRESLRAMPREKRLTRARMADDTIALESVSHDRDVMAAATSREAVSRLWDVCQVPDYRKISTQDHAELVGTLYKFLMAPEGRIPVDWFAKQVAFADRTDGDIDTLSTRIAHIRTWTFVSNRADWLADPEHWQGRARAIEDSLSDALHEQLTQRFVDRRTSALMRGLKDKDELVAEVAEDGAVKVADHFVGRLQGFRFFPDTQAEGIHGKATRNAAAHVLVRELSMRARRVAAAKNDAFKLNRQGHILWRNEEIGQLVAGDSPLKPLVELSTDEHLQAPDRDKIQERLNTWITEIISERLKPLTEIADAKDISGLARGIAFRLLENFGGLRREDVSEEMRALDQPARAKLRAHGVRFGAFNIYFPVLLKPASAELALTLWTLANAQKMDVSTLPEPPRAGLTSLIPDKAAPEGFYRVAGFHLSGTRAVRFDMLERLADLIRPLLAWRANPEKPDTPPKGATGDGGFRTTPEMMSILGCSANELGGVLQALGFRVERVRVKPEAAVAAVDSATAPTTADASAETAEAPSAAETAAEAVAPIEPSEVEVSAESEPAPEVVPAAVEAASQVASAEEQVAQAAAEEKWDEIWRPRRARGQQHRQHRRPHRQQQSEAAAPKTDTPPETKGREHRRDNRDGRDKGRPDRRERRREGGPHGGRRPDRPRQFMQSAGPKASAGVDPDSPFAALSRLKAAMEKTNPE
jgi:ATP-dependent RNA helicase SUPV3L1/SUV3